MRGGVILRAWRCVSLVAFFAGVLPDGHYLKLFETVWVSVAMIGVWLGVDNFAAAIGFYLFGDRTLFYSKKTK